MASESNLAPMPVDKDWDSIGVRSWLVSGHIQAKWSSSKGKWSEPVFTKSSALKIDGLSPALNYGQQAYEGMKAFRGPDNRIRIFRIRDHAARFSMSCECVSLPPVDPSFFEKCVLQAVAKNGEFVPPWGSDAMLYIRPVIFGSSAQLNLLPAEEAIFCVYVSPINALYGGVTAVPAVIYNDFDRAAPMGVGKFKIGGNYAPVFRWTRRARSEGFGLILHLDSKTHEYVDEFSSSGFIGVKKSTNNGFDLIMPQSPSAILSITAASCADIARGLGFKVETKPIHVDSLKEFDEVLAVGTAATIMPIKSITRLGSTIEFNYTVDFKDACFTRILEVLRDLQRGVIHDGYGWTTVVPFPMVAEGVPGELRDGHGM